MPQCHAIVTLQGADETPQETVVCENPLIEGNYWLTYSGAFYIPRKGGEPTYTDQPGAVPLWRVASIVPVPR